MRNCTSQLLFTLSLVYIVCAASAAPSSDKSRSKRSLLLDNVLHHRGQWRRLHRGAIKRSAFDTLDLDSLLNDPVFLEMGEPDTNDDFDYNSMDFKNLPDLSDLPPLEKDEMSNVIPGAHGPFDFQQVENTPAMQTPFSYNTAPAFPPNAHARHLADDMMDEFMQFLFMKEMGMLDQCLGFRKRR